MPQANETIPIPPHVPPRDAADFFISTGVGCAQILVLMLLPAIVAGLLTRSILVGLFTFPAMYVLWFLFSVMRLEVSPDGIRFVRVLGTPKFLAWKDISSITPASRKELIVYGWLWPPFPAREMTFSYSSSGHYAIRHGKRVTYYPPADPARFEAIVEQYLGR